MVTKAAPTHEPEADPVPATDVLEPAPVVTEPAPEAVPAPSSDDPEPTFFRAVKGIVDGFVHHTRDEVFRASPAVSKHFKSTGGVQDGEVLYVPASSSEFDSHAAKLAADEVARSAAASGGGGKPRGSEPVDMASGANT